MYMAQMQSASAMPFSFLETEQNLISANQYVYC